MCVSAPACDAGASVLAQRRQRRRRGGRDGVRAGRDASGRGQHRRRRLHDRPHAERRRHDVRLSREGAAQVDADDVSRRGRADRSRAHRGRLSGAGRAGHRARPGAGAQEVRQAAVEGRRHARRSLSQSGFAMSAALARSLNREAPGRDGDVSGVGRRVRQARRRRVGRRRPAGPARSREDAAGDRRRAAPTRSTRAGSPTASPRT